MVKKMKLNFNVRPITMKFLLIAVLSMAVVGILSGLNIIDFSDRVSPLFFPLVMPLIVLFDLGVMQLIKSRGKTFKSLSGIERVGLIISGISLSLVLLGVFDISIALLEQFSLFISIAVASYVVFVIFKK